jgi:hypothetical protein
MYDYIKMLVKSVLIKCFHRKGGVICSLIIKHLAKR